MKRILSMAMVFALAASQAFSYTTETLRSFSELSGATQAASAAITGISKSGASPEMEAIALVSKEVNSLMSYALMDFGFMPRIARVIEHVSAKASWQNTAKIDGQFFKEFGLALSYGITNEARAYFRGKGIALALQNITDNRIVARAAQALGEALSASIVETFFARINHLVLADKDTDAPKCSEVLFSSFTNSLATEIAYHFAGEILLRNASDTKSKDLFSDIFGAAN